MNVGFESEDLRDNEKFAYLIAMGIVPGLNYQDLLKPRLGFPNGKRPSVARKFDEGLKSLHFNYLFDNSKYEKVVFEKRFRIPRSFFDRTCAAITGKGIFVRSMNIISKKEIELLQPNFATLGILLYCIEADALDEYLQIFEEYSMLSLK